MSGLYLIMGHGNILTALVTAWHCPKITNMATKKISHAHKLIMWSLTRIASTVFPESWTRRSENDSTLGRPRSENANISWVWPFHTVIRCMVNYYATKSQAVMWFPQFHLLRPSLSWKVTKFRGTRKNWLSMTILNSDLLHHTVHHPAKFQAHSSNP